jgi:ribosome biogenesis protein MAK21
LPNFSALESLVTLTKFSNKTSSEVFGTVADLFIDSLLPPNRKLVPLSNRGNDWKLMKSKNDLDKATKDQIYAYWFYENQLRDHYHGFLLNIQASLQNGKEDNKTRAIICASKLLKSCPEREAFLLSIIVNKFGDPDKKVASKATYNLRQILLTHPNMAHVMVLETEKLVFRNNISELAQHYGIGFLSLIAPIANVTTSQKLINICFCFFKIKIEKGDINSKTMQSILNCLRLAIQNINDFNEEGKKIEITTPDVVNTIYRLIYLSKIGIAFQALSLLLQLVLVQDEKHDRYYNALYRKMIDPEVIHVSNKITSLYFHIIHRSIQQDSNVPRAKAFVKRLLQMTLSFPPNKACGALIVLNKILKSRPEILSLNLSQISVPIKKESKMPQVDMSKFDDSDDEEKYKDVSLEDNGKEEEKDEKVPVSSSWVHKKNSKAQNEEAEDSKIPTQYDPYKRSAAYCGADLSLFYELISLSKFFHPTVQVFVENILKHQKLKYFGDPLKDFSLNHFLERFAFKNPKKVETNEKNTAFNHTYQPKGSRGMSVHLLTDQNCTEDEKFIFDFLQKKREIKNKVVTKEDEESDTESVDDDEFDEYLNSLGAKKDFDDFDKDFDYLSELQKDTENNGEKKSKKKKKGDDSDDEIGDDWDDDDEDDGGESDGDNENDLDDEDNASGSEMDDEEMENDSEISMGSELDDTDEDEKPAKKNKKKKKGNENLFVAVDDFSEMIEKNVSSNQGTLGEIFNKDKSSQKQLDWETKRHGNGFKRKPFGKKSFGPNKKKFKK